MMFRFTTQHPWLSLLLSVMIALPLMVFVPKVQTVENVDYFTPEDDPDVVFYEKFKQVFGNDEFFIIAFKEKSIFAREVLTLIKEITSRLEKLDEVRDVLSLGNVDDIIGEDDFFMVQKFLERIPQNSKEIEDLRASAVNNPLYRDNLISKDGTTTAIVVFPHDRPEDKDLRKRLIGKTLEVLEPYKEQGKNFHLAGMTVTNLRLSQYMKSDVARFIPITYLVIIITIFIIFKDLKIALLSFSNISLCLGCTMGFIALIGSTLNNVTSIVPPLIMALCLSDSIHVFTHYLLFRKTINDNREALLKTLMNVYKPCLLTTVTTMAGFISLRISHIPAIKDFAFISSMGILLAFVFSFLFLPALILVFPPTIREKGRQTPKLLFENTIKLVIRLNNRYKYPILLICCGATVLGAFFLTRVKAETNLIDFFKKSAPLRQSLAFVETNLAGVEAINISIKGREKDVFREPKNLQFLEDVQAFIAGMPEIDITNSFVDFVKDMNESFQNEDPSYYKIPETRQLVSQYLLMYDSQDIDDFINSSYNHARILARTARHSSGELEAIIARIQHFLDKKTPAGFESRITGESYKVVNIVDDLVRGQIESLCTAVLIISVLMFLVLRSFSLGLLSLVPNLFPILLNFGIMGAFHIPLNTATALISAVAIGIAVDDTIHFLHQYKEETRITPNRRAAVEAALLNKGNAIITTSVILSLGFGILLLSSFVPTIQFGLLTALIMIFAVLGDLLFLPALLRLKEKSEKNQFIVTK
ncbi:MAG: MMPL family transporter [Deltaproteobacteria bacterium]|nr:MMPL family transporter [Deltaproteobacteria bacterium]